MKKLQSKTALFSVTAAVAALIMYALGSRSAAMIAGVAIALGVFMLLVRRGTLE